MSYSVLVYHFEGLKRLPSLTHAHRVCLSFLSCLLFCTGIIFLQITSLALNNVFSQWKLQCYFVLMTAFTCSDTGSFSYWYERFRDVISSFSKKILRLAGLQCWHCLSYGRFQMELCMNPDLIKKWKKIAKRAKEAAKRGEPFDPSNMLEAKFLRNLIEEFLQVLDSEVFPSMEHSETEDRFIDASDFAAVHDACVLYCERFMEFLIDLLSQLPTRRYIRPLVADVAVVAKCHLSALYKHEKGKLFAQLVDLLQFYETFEIDDHLGRQMTDDEVLLAHYDLFQSFQLFAFNKIPKLRELALANIGAINRRADLSKKLSVLCPEELRDLVCQKVCEVVE
nr:intron-binding protein aquarius [Ipomoea batatas]